jgi:hypothetical protein
MNELADIRNQAIHKFTIFRLEKDIGPNGAAATRFYLRAIGQDGNGKETSEEMLPYLEKTLQKIKG